MLDKLKLRLNSLKSINELDPVVIDYFKHLDLHRKNVLKVAEVLGISELGKLHDLDKYDPVRAKAYAYGRKDKGGDRYLEYMKHKNNHRLTNKHHPQYWYDKLDCMDFESFLEMIADWIGSGMTNDKKFVPRNTYRYYIDQDSKFLDPLPGIKEAAEEWMIEYGNHGNKYLNREKIKEIYDKYNKGILSEHELGGKVDLTK